MQHGSVCPEPTSYLWTWTY